MDTKHYELKIGCILVINGDEYEVEDYRSNYGQAEVVTRKHGVKHYFMLADVLRGLKDSRSDIRVK